MIDLEKKIDARVKKPFFTEMMILATTTGIDQKQYIKNIKELALLIRGFLEERNLIKKIECKPKVFWNFKGNKSIYNIDGGQLSLSVTGSASLGIRVGVLKNKPGDKTKDWCDFDESSTLSSNLVDKDNSHYEQEEESFIVKYDKMITGSRMIMEAAEVVKQHNAKGKWTSKPSVSDIVYLHGPIVYEATMYHLASDDNNPIPPFKMDFCKSLLSHQSDFFYKEFKKKELDKESRYFLPIYCEIINQIKKSKIPTYGIVERIRGLVSPGPVTSAILDELFQHNKFRLEELNAKKLNRTLDIKRVGTKSDGIKIKEKFEKRSVKDDVIFDLILDEGEYIKPVQIIKNPWGKWPRGKYSYTSYFDTVPEPYSSFLKISEFKRPIRIETLNVLDSYDEDMKFTFYSAKLLPQYCFPLGLDTVDKMTKVPGWMRNAMRNEYVSKLLRKTLDSNESKENINMVLKSFLSGRNWWVRPK